MLDKLAKDWTSFGLTKDTRFNQGKPAQVLSYDNLFHI